MEENAMDIPNGAEMKIKNVIVKSRKRCVNYFYLIL
jgi:hypothetical protein